MTLEDVLKAWASEVGAASFGLKVQSSKDDPGWIEKTWNLRQHGFDKHESTHLEDCLHDGGVTEALDQNFEALIRLAARAAQKTGQNMTSGFNLVVTQHNGAWKHLLMLAAGDVLSDSMYSSSWDGMVEGGVAVLVENGVCVPSDLPLFSTNMQEHILRVANKGPYAPWLDVSAKNQFGPEAHKKWASFFKEELKLHTTTSINSAKPKKL